MVFGSTGTPAARRGLGGGGAQPGTPAGLPGPEQTGRLCLRGQGACQAMPTPHGGTWLRTVRGRVSRAQWLHPRHVVLTFALCASPPGSRPLDCPETPPPRRVPCLHPCTLSETTAPSSQGLHRTQLHPRASRGHCGREPSALGFPSAPLPPASSNHVRPGRPLRQVGRETSLRVGTGTHRADA